MNAALLAGRLIAIAIAILGAIDPAITSLRRTKPEIAIVALDRRDSTLASRVASELDADFTVVRGPFAGAAATVIVGNALPDQTPGGVVFGVRRESPMTLSGLTLPPLATTEARIPIVIKGEATSSTPIEIELLANGTVVDRVFQETTTSGDAFSVTLMMTPATMGPLVVQARATLRGDTAVVEAMTDVIDSPKPILFFDRRPSWMSTFVRRALERDRRFAVASRTITSRGISTAAGQPPSSLSDPTVLELYDVIVVGAPASLTAADVSGLEAFLRRRGGVVVLLFDERPTGGTYDRLTGASRWTGATLNKFGEADGGKLRMTEVAWPTVIPRESIARLEASVNGDRHPAVWSTMLGRGEVIVNGALDAWKFRDASTSGFDEFWRATISRAASDAVPAIDVQLSRNLVEPGDDIVVKIITRDSSAGADVVVVSDSGSAPLRVWPSATRRGEFEGRFSAPATIGAFAVRATANGVRGERRFVVQARVERPPSADWRAIQTLATATGGQLVGVDEIAEAVGEKVVAQRRRERWWPMRSVWWLVPFVGLLGVEWFARRRRGLA